MEILMDGIPGNFVDSETGEALRPVYKWQDAMGVWHQKDIALCSWGELRSAYVNLWNYHMQACMEPEVEVKKLGFVDMLKIFSYTYSVISLIIAVIILVAMFVE